ncbi:MAG: MOSC N-terminal beta barrel domain-containing protein [Planctomycetaceae bacterium]
MPHVARITLRPVRGLDGVAVSAARVLASGALDHDRRWRLVDAEGGCVDGRSAPLGRVRATFDLAAREVGLTLRPWAGRGPAAASFPLLPGPDGPCPWLSEALGRQVFLEERPGGGFPDDADAPGPTVAATASLERVAEWFGLDLDDVRRRLMIGLEIEGCDAFWEDSLVAPAPTLPLPGLAAVAGLAADPWGERPPPVPLAFLVGTARYAAVAVRPLDAEAARDPVSGLEREGFREIFEAWRRRRMRRDVDPAAWDGLFRLGATTVGDGLGGDVAVGDRLSPAAHRV